MGLSLYPAGGSYGNRVPPYPFAGSRDRVEISLRDEMKLMLEGNGSWPRRGHWILLRRMDRRQRCFCWNEKGRGEDQYTIDQGKYNEPRQRCPSCNGEGWVYEDELHLSRRRLVSPEIGLAGQEVVSDVGFININYIVFYFQHYVNPSYGDKILELKLNDVGEPLRPYEYFELYRIAVAEPFRDLYGRIEYWRCSCKLEVV